MFKKRYDIIFWGLSVLSLYLLFYKYDYSGNMVENILMTFIASFIFSPLFLIIYFSLRNWLFGTSINNLLNNNKSDEANEKLRKAIKNRPKLIWLKGFQAVLLNITGYITEFENYASELLNLPLEKLKGYYAAILRMQNINDYLSGRELRNYERMLSYYFEKQYKPRGPKALNKLVTCYYTELYDEAIEIAKPILAYPNFFYKTIAASVLANVSYKNQDIVKAKEYAEIALNYAPSDEMKDLFKKLHKDVLNKEDIK